MYNTSRSRYLPASGQATLEEAQLNGKLVLAAALDYAAAGLPVLPLSWNRTVIASCPACKPGRGCAGRDQCRCRVRHLSRLLGGHNRRGADHTLVHPAPGLAARFAHRRPVGAGGPGCGPGQGRLGQPHRAATGRAGHQRRGGAAQRQRLVVPPDLLIPRRVGALLPGGYGHRPGAGAGCARGRRLRGLGS